jgi:hypothetical protein
MEQTVDAAAGQRVTRAGKKVPTTGRAPTQEQGKVPGVDAGRPLGPVGAQSKVPQVGVGGRYRHPGVVHHGPLGERARQLQNLCPNGVPHTSAPKTTHGCVTRALKGLKFPWRPAWASPTRS